MSHALLSRISSAKLHTFCLSVPAHCDKCCCIAFCGVSILVLVEGPSQSSLQPFAPQERFKPSLVPAALWSLTVLINEGVRPRCGQGGEVEQSFMLCAPQKPPSAQPAQEKSRGHPCPALSSQLFPPAQPPAQTLGEMLMLPSSPCQPGGACLLHLLVRWDLTLVKQEAFGLTGVSKAWDHSWWFTT